MAHFSTNLKRKKLGKMSNNQQAKKTTETGFNAITFLNFDEKASRKRLPGNSMSLWRTVRERKNGTTKIASGVTFSAEITKEVKKVEDEMGRTLRLAIGINSLTNEVFLVFGTDGVEFNHGPNYMIRREDVVGAVFNVAGFDARSTHEEHAVMELIKIKPLTFKLGSRIK